MWFPHDATMTGWMWGWAAFGWLTMVAFWGAVIALVVWVVRRLTAGPDTPTTRASALDIAKERYARGEITREEYEQLRRDLQ